MKSIQIFLIILELLTLNMCLIVPQDKKYFCEPPKSLSKYKTCFLHSWKSLIPIDTHIEKVKEIRLASNVVNIIMNDSFKPFHLSASTLMLDLPEREIIIEPNAFNSMSQLTTLEINNAIIKLRKDTFSLLHNLKSLKIQVLSSTMKYLDGILKNNIKNLENLELLNHYNIDICNYYNLRNPSIDFLNLRKLQFTGGILTTLFTGCFKCLKNLEQLTIIKSNLTFLEPEIFEYLYKLENVTLVSNDKLTHIPSNVFNIPTLKFIDLSNNSIKNIDDKAFTANNDINLLLLNLSYNALKIIEINVLKNIHCSSIDFTHNSIQTIESGAFNGSHIEVIYLYDNRLDDEDEANFEDLDSNYTRLYLHYQPYEEAIHQEGKQKIEINVLTGKIQYCYFSNYHSFEICKASKSLSSVKLLVPDMWTPSSLEILDNEISSIDNNVFHNLNISVLIITSAAENFKLNQESFTGLDSLQVLKLKTKPISFEISVFNPLKSLILLEISIGRFDLIQCQLLNSLKNLQKLSISNAAVVNVCSEICKNTKYNISILHYTNSFCTNLQLYAFSCLERLEFLSITNSRLETISPGAFDGLSKLQSLEITFSRLTRIHRNTFEMLTNLNRLILRNNTINVIDDESFINNKLLSILDLSFNSLESIHEKTFNGANIKNLDLSYNYISLIENGAFGNLKNLAHLYVHHNNRLIKDTMTWNVMESQIETRCQIHDKVVVCFKHNSISSVDVYEEEFSGLSFFGVYIEVHTKELRITCDDFVTSIGKYAFKESNIHSELKTLAICRKRKNKFVLYPESFEGLTTLENLIIDVGVIELKIGLFDSLKSLKYLKIKPNEILTQVYLGQVLANLTNLKTLEISNNDSISICQSPFSGNLPQSITELCYTNGRIDKLEEASFTCLPYLENITITKTQLMVVESYAFNGPNNLKYLNLAFNEIWYIYSDVFKDLGKLIKLELNHNKISKIENKAFTIENNDNLRLINLSYNEISIVKSTIFQDIKCNQLDLTHNKIGAIEDAAFKGSLINDIYLFDNLDIDANRNPWMVANHTFVFSKKISYSAIRCQSKQRNNCISCHYNCLQPQDRALIERSL